MKGRPRERSENQPGTAERAVTRRQKQRVERYRLKPRSARSHQSPEDTGRPFPRAFVGGLALTPWFRTSIPGFVRHSERGCAIVTVGTHKLIQPSLCTVSDPGLGMVASQYGCPVTGGSHGQTHGPLDTRDKQHQPGRRGWFPLRLYHSVLCSHGTVTSLSGRLLAHVPEVLLRDVGAGPLETTHQGP